LPPLVHKEQASARLHLGETLLAAGLGPRELIELRDRDPSPLDVLKAGYNPDEPRVPAGIPTAANGLPRVTRLHRREPAKAPVRPLRPAASHRVLRAEQRQNNIGW